MFYVTYEIITEESAEHGEPEETGFELENVTLREAYDFLRWQGGYCEPNCSDTKQATWLNFYCESDFRTGETKNYAVHMPRNATSATRARIARLFKAI